MTIPWHYTMAWLPASLLKTHRRLKRAQGRTAHGSFMKGDVMQQW